MSRLITSPSSTGIRGYDEFEIDLEAILRAQIPPFFRQFPAAPLTAEAIKAIPAHTKGAYILYLDHHAVYAGKTDTKHGFRDRLERHSWTIQGRSGLDASRLSFKAIRIMVFSAFDVEAILIAEMKKANPTDLRWNNSGFGSNDPGRNRDGQQPAEFDKSFPIDIDITLEKFPIGKISLRDVVRELKSSLPYLIRNGKIPDDIDIIIKKEMTVRSLLELVARSLPSGWQITIFHGRVVIYRETQDYDYKLEIMRS